MLSTIKSTSGTISITSPCIPSNTYSTINSMKSLNTKSAKLKEYLVKEVVAFSFDGTYGTTHVMTFASEDGKKYKYMGSKPPAIYEDGFYNVKATIKHDSYNEVDETKLLRIKTV